MKVCTDNEHLVVDILMDCVLQKYKLNLFVSGLLLHVVKNYFFNLSSVAKRDLSCRKTRDVLTY